MCKLSWKKSLVSVALLVLAVTTRGCSKPEEPAVGGVTAAGEAAATAAGIRSYRWTLDPGGRAGTMQVFGPAGEPLGVITFSSKWPSTDAAIVTPDGRSARVTIATLDDGGGAVLVLRVEAEGSVLTVRGNLDHEGAVQQAEILDGSGRRIVVVEGGEDAATPQALNDWLSSPEVEPVRSSVATLRLVSAMLDQNLLIALAVSRGSGLQFLASIHRSGDCEYPPSADTANAMCAVAVVAGAAIGGPPGLVVGGVVCVGALLLNVAAQNAVDRCRESYDARVTEERCDQLCAGLGENPATGLTYLTGDASEDEHECWCSPEFCDADYCEAALPGSVARVVGAGCECELPRTICGDRECAADESCRWAITHDSVWYDGWGLDADGAFWDANGDQNHLSATIDLPEAEPLVLAYEYSVEEAGTPADGCAGTGVEHWGNHTHLNVTVDGSVVATHWGEWNEDQLGKSPGPFSGEVDLSTFAGTTLDLSFQASGINMDDPRPYGDGLCWCGCAIRVREVRLEASGASEILLPCE